MSSAAWKALWKYASNEFLQLQAFKVPDRSVLQFERHFRSTPPMHFCSYRHVKCLLDLLCRLLKRLLDAFCSLKNTSRTTLFIVSNNSSEPTLTTFKVGTVLDNISGTTTLENGGILTSDGSVCKEKGYRNQNRLQPEPSRDIPSLFGL